MTNEEAIEVIEQDIPCEYDTDLIEALNMAIAALKAEPCEDCVSRKRVKYLIHTLRIPKEYEQPLWDGLDDLPPVTPKPRSGKWEVYKQHQDEYLICDQCRRMYSRWMIAENFCPNCGAKMEGVSE